MAEKFKEKPTKKSTKKKKVEETPVEAQEILPTVIERPRLVEYRERIKAKDGKFVSKYLPIFSTADFINEFIRWCEQESVPRTVFTVDENGVKTKNSVTIPRVLLPSEERFARYIGVYPDTIDNWKKAYPEFKKAMKYLMSLQKDKIIELGSAGIGHQGVHKLLLMSNHGMAEKKEVDNNHLFGLLKNVYTESENIVDNKTQEAKVIDVFKED